jgi:hypothetical protein
MGASVTFLATLGVFDLEGFGAGDSGTYELNPGNS